MKRRGLGPQIDRRSDYKEEEVPMIMDQAEAAPMHSRADQPKKVKSKITSTVSEDIYGDTEQMR